MLRESQATIFNRQKCKTTLAFFAISNNNFFNLLRSPYQQGNIGKYYGDGK